MIPRRSNVKQMPIARCVSQRRLARFLKLQKLLEKILLNAQELIEIMQAWEEDMSEEIRQGAPVEPGEIKAYVSGRKLIVR